MVPMCMETAAKCSDIRIPLNWHILFTICFAYTKNGLVYEKDINPGRKLGI